MSAKNIKLTLSYFGQPFKGWQRVEKERSVEDTLREALETVLQHPITLQAASRTDAGVHARGQVVNFFTSAPCLPLNRLTCSLNRLLKAEICIHSAEEMPLAFHPTLDSQGKEYEYHICYGTVQLPFYKEISWHFPHTLDILEMQRAATLLLGTRDFSSLCNQRALWNRPSFCTLYSIQIIPTDTYRLKIVIRGDRFLYKMMRNLCGTLAYIGCGKLQTEALPEILNQKDRTLSGVTAPAHGLFLNQVFYDPR